MRGFEEVKISRALEPLIRPSATFSPKGRRDISRVTLGPGNNSEIPRYSSRKDRLALGDKKQARQAARAALNKLEIQIHQSGENARP